MIKKLERFVASLTDQEINAQINDIFDWARVYKELLETEQAHRRSNNNINQRSSPTRYNEPITNYGECDDGFNYEIIDEELTGMSVDYDLIQVINRKISGLSVEKTREQLDRLKQIPTYNLSPSEMSQLQYEIEVCELHLLELIGETEDDSCFCSCCGSELESNAKFCGKCGVATKRV